MIEDAKLDELLALAKKATPGKRKWVPENPKTMGEYKCLIVEGQDPYRVGFPEYLVRGSADLGGGEWFTDCDPDDAAFIAALDPDTIRQLVQEVKDWRASMPYMAPPVHIMQPIPEPQLPDDPEQLTKLREQIEINIEAARLFDQYGPDWRRLHLEQAKLLATAVDEGGVNDTIERTGKGSFEKP